ncbi:hypothetical protein Aconfl_06430 [Algoriphagus confluentis]|uniref:Uncharacterized protein n=1 Tax=Algoriphagus confluentis TaxID=1697556 RepID=A0ABQ6PL41_9BACT|nr:hypothetical protein Aconfl_06430 [Algoriphagus confluentis]
MEYLKSFAYLLILGVLLAFILGIFWLVFYYSWKTWKEFRRSKN